MNDTVITRWATTEVEDTSAAMGRVVTTLEGTFRGQNWNAEHSMGLTFGDDTYDAMVGGQQHHGGGFRCVSSLLPL